MSAAFATVDPVVSEEDFSRYRARIVILRESFTFLGKGSQQSAAFDCRIHPSLVSNVLRAQVYNLKVCSQLEEWVSGKIGESQSCS